MRNTNNLFAAGIAAALLTTALATGPAASAQSGNDDNRQKDKNTMRSLGIGLGAAAVLQALQGKGTGALLLGAGAAYAGKRYEDDRKAQQDAQDREDRENRERRERDSQRKDDYRSERDRNMSSHPRYSDADYRSGSGTAFSNSMPAEPIRVFVNDDRVQFSDQKPEMTAGNVYVPMRGVLEKIGANVRWDAQSRSVIAEEGNKTVYLPVNGVATVNGEKMPLDTPAYIQDGRTMVPLRFLAQTFGARVNWNEDEHAVHIDTDRAMSMNR